MCVEVYFIDEKRSARTVGDLEAAIVCRAIGEEEGFSLFQGCCLCPVNIEATLEAAGFAFSEDTATGYQAWRNPDLLTGCADDQVFAAVPADLLRRIADA